MPWHIEHREDEWCVVKDADGSTEKCHPTEERAKRHMAALYAAEPNARSVEMRASCSSYFSSALNSENPASALKSICALDRGSSITALSERFGLPHHSSPGAPPDRDCVAAVLAAIGGAQPGLSMSG